LKLRAPLLLSDQHQVDLGFGLGHDGSCARLLPKVVTAGSEGHAAQASRTPSVFPAPATAGATNFLFSGRAICVFQPIVDGVSG
jgi:hypothetical protein